jgi:hypothetical protein
MQRNSKEVCARRVALAGCLLKKPYDCQKAFVVSPFRIGFFCNLYKASLWDADAKHSIALRHIVKRRHH